MAHAEPAKVKRIKAVVVRVAFMAKIVSDQQSLATEQYKALVIFQATQECGRRLFHRWVISGVQDFPGVAKKSILVGLRVDFACLICLVSPALGV